MSSNKNPSKTYNIPEAKKTSRNRNDVFKLNYSMCEAISGYLRLCLRLLLRLFETIVEAIAKAI